MFYVFNKDGYCVASCNYEPDADDLASRGESYIVSEEIYDLSRIKLVDGVITVIPEPESSLDELKQAKLVEINNWTESKIVSGFVSECTGEKVTYDSDKETQLTMQGIALNVNTELFKTEYPTGCPVRGYPADGKTKQIYMLTPEQVMRWCADLSMHIGDCKQAGWAKQAEVNAAETKEELEKIILE